MNNNRFINCDMDGVLVDMDLFIIENLPPAAHGNDAVMWPMLEKMPHFYRRMKPTPYAKRLWQAIIDTGWNHRVLTAIPKVTTIPDAEQDKNIWVDYHAPTVFCGERPQVLIGPYSKDKWKHCLPGDLLIDDKEDNCAQWETAGGIAICHDGNITKTLIELGKAVQ